MRAGTPGHSRTGNGSTDQSRRPHQVEQGEEGAGPFVRRGRPRQGRARFRRHRRWSAGLRHRDDRHQGRHVRQTRVAGALAITIDRAVAWNGSDVPLVSRASDKGDNNTAVVTTAALFISAPAIFFRGSNAVIESGTILRAQVAARTYLEDGPYAAPVPDRPSGRRTRPRR